MYLPLLDLKKNNKKPWFKCESFKWRLLNIYFTVEQYENMQRQVLLDYVIYMYNTVHIQTGRQIVYKNYTLWVNQKQDT